MIPYGRQCIDQKDIDAVVDVLESDFLTQGPQVPAFESALCHYTGADRAIAVNSATSALHIACLALDLSKGDWLWTSPITFVASANCGLYCGAKVDFIDIDPTSYNLCPMALEKKHKKAKEKNKLPKVIVVVHLSGQSCDMKSIHALSKQYGFRIIEDASHAIGGRYQEQKIGSCYYSDITVFSFHPVKIITTAEGGIALTNNSDLAEKMVLLRSHGITRTPQDMRHEPDGPWYYEQIDLGYNYRMTDIQAALGCSQLKHIDKWVKKRHLLAENYNQLLKNLPIQLPAQSKETFSSCHLYIIRLQLDRLKKTKKSIFEELQQAGIGINLHYIPIYKQPFYQDLGFDKSYCTEAENFYKEAMSIPLHPSLSETEQAYIVKTIREIIIT